MTSSARQDSFDAEYIFDFLGRVSLEYVHADLGLLFESFSSLGTPGLFGLPALTFASNLSVGLKFDVVVDDERRALFGLISKKRSERLADLEIKMKVAPTTGVDVQKKPAVIGTWPAYIERVSGRRMHIRLLNDRKVRLAYSDTFDYKKTRVFFSGDSSMLFRKLPQPLLAEIILTLADWVREEDFAQPTALQSDPTGPLGNLLSTLTEGFDDLYCRLMPALRGSEAADSAPESWANVTEEMEQRRTAISSYLGALEIFYDLVRLEARLKLILDENGELATKPFQKDAQQYDIRVSKEETGGQTALLLKLWVPDFLVGGEIYRQFLSFLSQTAGLHQLYSELKKRWRFSVQPSPVELKNYLLKARDNQSAIIIRTRRGKENQDHDLFLVTEQLKGQIVTLMFGAELEFRDRDASGGVPELKKIKKLVLHASRFNGGQWQEFNGVRKANLKYLHKVLLSQYRWRGRFD